MARRAAENALEKLGGQRGAPVAASRASAHVLRLGIYDPDDDPDDPLCADRLRGPTPVKQVRIIGDGETLMVGPLALMANFTPGHTPGGTSTRTC